MFKIQQDNKTNINIYVDFMVITIVQNSFIISAYSKRNGCYSNKRIKVQYKTKQNVPSRILFVCRSKTNIDRRETNHHQLPFSSVCFILDPWRR